MRLIKVTEANFDAIRLDAAKMLQRDQQNENSDIRGLAFNFDQILDWNKGLYYVHSEPGDDDGQVKTDCWLFMKAERLWKEYSVSGDDHGSWMTAVKKP